MSEDEAVRLLVEISQRHNESEQQAKARGVLVINNGEDSAAVAANNNARDKGLRKLRFKPFSLPSRQNEGKTIQQCNSMG